MRADHDRDSEEDPMRWSGYAGADGAVRTAVWHEDRLHPVPTGASLVELLGDDGTRRREAAEAAPATCRARR
jgi:hypothetical protein